jgi:hypothetical protein
LGGDEIEVELEDEEGQYDEESNENMTSLRRKMVRLARG